MCPAFCPVGVRLPISKALERVASGMWHQSQLELRQKQSNTTLTEAEQHQLVMTESQMITAMVGLISCLVCGCDIAFGLYIMRKLYKSQTGDGEEGQDSGGEPKQGNPGAEGIATASDNTAVAA